MIRAYNLLIDANITAIESVILKETIKTTYQNLLAWIGEKINPFKAKTKKD
jgi:hypothetical protein